LILRPAKNTEDLVKIISLQRENLKINLSLKEQKKEGFVTVQHTLKQLEKLQSFSPQILAEKGNILAGYALVMTKELSDEIPVLSPMFKLLNSLSYKGVKLKNLNYYVMGQVCIAKNFRGQGLFRQLYSSQKALLAKLFDFCITEISTSNLRSLKAHQRLGFTVIHVHHDPIDEWNIVLWDWTS
jgi:GNAT superfamily N-acetyltransferase